MRRRGVLAAAWALLAAPVAAEMPAGDAAALPLEPVVVTATRSERAPFEVPAAIDAVGAAQIEANRLGANLSEVLAGIPGLLARNRENYAQDQQLSVRGFGTRAPFGIIGLRLYLDGIPATAPDGQGQVSHFNLDTAERVEVLRGPFSTLYGNAAGGVIQMFTAPGREPTEIGVEVNGGRYGATRSSLSARGLAGDVDYNVGYTHFQTDGFREHSRARRESGNVRLGTHFGATRLSLVANVLSIPEAQDPLGVTRAQFEGDPEGATPSALQFNTRKSVDQTQAGVIGEHDLGEGQRLRLMGYYGTRSVEQFLAIPVAAQSNSALHSGGVVDLGNDYGGSDLRWSWERPLAGYPLSLVAGLAYDRQDSERRGYENFIGEQLGVKGALRREEDNAIYDFDQYMQAGWQWSPQWSALAGVRRSVVRFRSDDHYLTDVNPDDSGRLEYTATTPALGLMFHPAASLRVYLSYGKGFDSPTFAELAYRADGASGLNTGLRAARTDSYELGAKWRPLPGLRVNAALFQSDTEDEIVIATAQGGRSTYQNAPEARRRGFELAASAEVARALNARLAYTWLDASFDASYETCTVRVCATPNTTIPAGNRVPGVPRSNLYGEWRWGAERGWNAALSGQYLSRVAVNSTNAEYAPAYAVFALDGGYRWESRDARLQGRFYLRLDNLLDRHYAGSVIVNDVNGQYYEPGPGRSALAGVELRWRP